MDGKLRPWAARRLALVGFDALRRVAARKRQRVRGVLRAFRRSQHAIFVRHLGAVRRFRRGEIETRLHEHESRLIGALLLPEQQRLRTRRAAVVRKQTRREEHENDRQQVDDERDQHAFAEGYGAPNRVELRPVVLEIEIHQEVSSISAGAWDSGFGIRKSMCPLSPESRASSPEL